VLLAVMLLVVCAVGLGWSSLTARTASSVVLTYLTVAFVGVGLPILFLLTTPMVIDRDVTRRVDVLVPVDSSASGTEMRCVEEVRTGDRAHLERTWWLLAANPYVVLADASPRPAGSTSDDVLSALRSGVRMARLGDERECVQVGKVYASWDEAQRESRAREDALGVSWPYGLALNLALAVGFAVTAVRGLRAPARKLARGTRVA
jgi:hypothetical protein